MFTWTFFNLRFDLQVLSFSSRLSSLRTLPRHLLLLSSLLLFPSLLLSSLFWFPSQSWLLQFLLGSRHYLLLAANRIILRHPWLLHHNFLPLLQAHHWLHQPNLRLFDSPSLPLPHLPLPHPPLLLPHRRQ